MQSKQWQALICPDCRSELSHVGNSHQMGPLSCQGCHQRWPIRGGLPRLYREAWVEGP